LIILISVIPPFLIKDSCTIIASKDFINQVYVYNTDGNTQRFTYSYDSIGTKPSVFCEVLDMGVWVKSSKDKFVYNQKGNVLSYINERKEDNQWTSNIEINTYDSLDNIISAVFKKQQKGISTNVHKYIYSYSSNFKERHTEEYSWNDDNWEIQARSTSKYNLNMQPLYNLCEIIINGQWFISGIDSTAYDIEGRTICALRETWDLGELFSFDKYTYTYDSNGYNQSLLHEWSDVNDQGKKEQFARRETYIRLKSGKVTSYLMEDLVNGKWTESYLTTNEYNAEENLITNSTEIWENNEQVEKDIVYYTYNSNSNILTANSETWWSGKLMYTFRSTYTYDLNYNLLLHLSEKKEKEQWGNTRQLIYTYDANNRLLTYDKEEWINGNWLKRYVEIFTYDSIGKTISYQYEKYTDGVLRDVFRRRYQYNTNGNLVKENSEAKGLDWRFYDTNFSFGDLRNNSLSFYGYQIDITYNGFNPVNEKIATAGFSLSISPNPTTGPLNINYTLTEPALTSISISNMLGIEMANISENQFQLPGTYNLNYNASNLAPGVYFITVKARNKTETKKIVINY
jgi:hypothetical protein